MTLINDRPNSLKSFQALVLSYTHVLVCRERLDGSLRGIMFIGIERKKRDELNYTLIKVSQPVQRGLGTWRAAWEPDTVVSNNVVVTTDPLHNQVM